MEIKIVLTHKLHRVFELRFEVVKKRLRVSMHLIVLHLRVDDEFAKQF